MRIGDDTDMKRSYGRIRGILSAAAGALMTLSPLTTYAAGPVMEKVINLVIGGRLVEITLPIGSDIPKGKKIIIRYGFEEIVVNLDTGAYATTKPKEEKYKEGK